MSARTITVTTRTPGITATETKKTVNVYPFDSGTRAILKSLGTAKGDMVGWTGAGTVAKVPAGSTGQVWTVVPGEASGMGWADAPGGVIPQLNNYRATLESGVSVSVSDQTAKTVLYWTPHNGNRFAIYDGGWEMDTPDELSIKATDTQSGNTTNGNKIITGLSDTSQLIAGMEVTGAGIGVAAVVDTIDSATQVTVDVNSTADGTGVSITFKLPADSNVDLFGIPVSGAIKLRWGPLWTNGTTRATALTKQNGVDVLTGLAAWRCLGSLKTASTAGQLTDSLRQRLLNNIDNRVRRRLWRQEPTASWTYGTAATRQAMANALNQVEVILPLASDQVTMTYKCHVAAGAVTPFIKIGLDNTTTWGGLVSESGMANHQNALAVTYDGEPGIGYHYLAMLEYLTAAVNSTFYGSNSDYGGFYGSVLG